MTNRVQVNFLYSFFSEIRYIEVMEEPPICNYLLKYRLHKERNGISRFDKNTPQTMKSLTDLVYVLFNFVFF